MSVNKSGRPREAGAARAAILVAADALFYERGVTSTTMHEIADAAGVTRRTLYYHFASKEALVAEYLTRRDVGSRALLLEAAGSSDSHATNILAVFRALDVWFRTRRFRGCALTNAVAEKGDAVVIAGPITLRHKRAIRDWFVRACVDAGAGEPADLAEELMLLFDGALTSVATRKDLTVARRAETAARTLMAARGVRFGTR